MSWTIARIATPCSCCPVVIEAGQPARFGDLTPVVWCPACALRLLDEDVPALEPPEPAAAAIVPAPIVLPLFGESMARRFQSADAREAIEGLRAAIDGQAKGGAR